MDLSGGSCSLLLIPTPIPFEHSSCFSFFGPGRIGLSRISFFSPPPSFAPPACTSQLRDLACQGLSNAACSHLRLFPLIYLRVVFACVSVSHYSISPPLCIHGSLPSCLCLDFCTMKILTWNLCGLNNKFKRKRVIDHCCSMGPLPKVLCFQELKVCLGAFLKGFQQLKAHYHIRGSGSSGSYGGVVTCIRHDWTAVDVAMLVPSFAHITTIRRDGQLFHIINVYCPRAPSQ